MLKVVSSKRNVVLFSNISYESARLAGGVIGYNLMLATSVTKVSWVQHSAQQTWHEMLEFHSLKLEVKLTLFG